MTLRLFSLLLAGGLIAAPLAAVATPAEGGLAVQQDEAARAEIGKAIGFYFQGHATGDPAHFRKAFLPTAHIEGIRNGVFTSWTLDAYCLVQGSAGGRRSDAETHHRRPRRVGKLGDGQGDARSRRDGLH
jgi:hypothetical protein